MIGDWEEGADGRESQHYECQSWSANLTLIYNLLRVSEAALLLSWRRGRGPPGLGITSNFTLRSYGEGDTGGEETERRR